jgi:tryptophanyl-tRNA synthetase
MWEKLRPAATDPARKTKKDPGNPDICNIFTLHQGFSPADTQKDVAQKCRTAGWGCLDCKRVLADNMIAALAPIRERAAELRAHPERVQEALRSGARKAQTIAAKTLADVRSAMGFMPGA